MLEQFTIHARQAMALANKEAMRYRQQYIGTEHILAGLAAAASGTAAVVLRDLGITLPKIRSQIDKLLKARTNAEAANTIPQTPQAKKVVEYAINECRSLGHHSIATGHLLLGLVHDTDAVARQVLLNLGLQPHDLRTRTLNALSQDPELQPGPASATQQDGPAEQPAADAKGTNFSGWWTDKQKQLAQEPPEVLAEAAWNAALRAAVLLLSNEQDRLVKSTDYEMAVGARDGRLKVEGLFSHAGVWNGLLGYAMQAAADMPTEAAKMEWYRRTLKDHSTEHLQRLRLFLPTDAILHAAIDSLVTERQLRSSP